MPGRNRAWADQLLANSLTAGGGSIKLNLLENAPTMDTLTAIRIVGELEVAPTPTSEVEFTQIVDIGIGVSSSEAFSIGITALPDPAAETEYPPRGWLYVARQIAVVSLPTGGTPVAIYRKHAMFKFDLRAMRKIDKGTLFMFMRNTDHAGTATNLTIFGRVRVLCLT